MVGGASLQINLAPPDVPYAKHVLPHQLETWADQVSEMVLTVDLRRPTGAQFGDGWRRNLPALRDLLGEVTQRWPACRVAEVDYSPAAQAQLAERLFAGVEVPVKDFRGGPFYSYFYGLLAARSRYVLHLDADMMFGGRSRSWLEEAIAALRHSPEVLFVNPFAGPPAADGALVEGARYEHQRLGPLRYRFRDVSTRIFLVDLERLYERACPLPALRVPGLRVRVGALKSRRGNHALAEEVLTVSMRQAGMFRLDMLGQSPGMWTLHPVDRDERYFGSLPALIGRVERGEVTDQQVGRYNLHPSMLS